MRIEVCLLIDSYLLNANEGANHHVDAKLPAAIHNEKGPQRKASIHFEIILFADYQILWNCSCLTAC